MFHPYSKWPNRFLFIVHVMLLFTANTSVSSTEPSRTVNGQKPSASPTTTTANQGQLDDVVVSASTCHFDDFACLTMAANDRLGLEAIRSLHRKLDDDQNGNVDLSESDDFLREELKYASNYERRQMAFHRDDDFHISVKELWDAWLRSEVHNWTVEDTTEWLKTNVALPQYMPGFVLNKVTGANLPRLAINNANYLNILGIKDPIHRQKIALKAMDVVLFGPPKDSGPLWKDRILIMLVVIIGISGTYAYRQHKRFKLHLNRMNRDMDSLQNAEKALENLQHELEVARQVQETVITEKKNLEKRLQDSKTDLNSITNSYSDLEFNQLKAEIEMLRTELQLAKNEVNDRSWSPPPGLQQWLQLTYEIENKAYLKKKILAEKQLQHAREACEKLRKKRSSLVGAFVSTHGKSIDDVDRSIVEARTSLNEVTQELQERAHRWKQIELLCDFNIISNSGLQFLERVLGRSLANGPATISVKGRISSQDDLDDDSSSVYGSQLGTDTNWKESDSSSSDTSRAEPEDLTPQPVHFVVGNDVSPWDEDICSAPAKTTCLSTSTTTTTCTSSSNSSNSNNNNSSACQVRKIGGTNSMKGSSASSQKRAPPPLIRSMSQEINLSHQYLPAATTTTELHAFAGLHSLKAKSKLCQSELALAENKRSSPQRPSPIREISPSSSTVIATIADDDVCSTDSSLIEDDVKKRKRKLFGFSKKTKGKSD